MFNKKIEKTISLYNNAISSWQYSSQVTWSRNAVMLTANSILIGIIGLSFQFQFPFFFLQDKLLNMVLSSFGIIICMLWWVLFQRSDSFTKYYLHTAREIEEQHFSDLDLSLFVRCAKLIRGETIKFDFKDGKPEKVKIPCPSQLSNKWIVWIIILLFIIFYFFTILYFFSQ